MKLLIIENIRISLRSVQSHLLRTILTILIIAFGIMALVGILTTIDSLKISLTDNFSMMGSNTFTIRNVGMFVHGPNGGERKENKFISLEEATNFRKRFVYDDATSVFFYATGLATAKYMSEKTNPNITVMGVDENYLSTAGYELESGRNMTRSEIENGAHVVIVGSEIVSRLMGTTDPIGKEVRIGPARFVIIGVLKAKGSSMGFSGDRNCLLPIHTANKIWNRSDISFSVNVKAPGAEMMDAVIGEATGLFRSIRKLSPAEEDNFEIVKSDNLVTMFLENIRYVTLAATIIGLITLMGAAIGLMNIMLVSVTERTREIGIRKATGATNKAIRNQFLAEAVVIGILGGLIGIILGTIIGNIVSFSLGSRFIMPWMWILLGIVLCVAVGLVSGIYPAAKASKLDPIESLRYE